MSASDLSHQLTCLHSADHARGFPAPSQFCNECRVAWTVHVTPVHPRSMTRLLIALIACAALIAGCGSDEESGMTEGGSAARDTAAEAAGANGEAAGTDGEATGEDGGTDGARDGGDGGDGASGGAITEDGAAAAKAARGPRVTLRDSQFGPVLFDGHNRALYLFTRDPRRKTRCYGACADAWPPFYAKGRPRAGRGVDRDLLGTIERRDGRRQVTYKGQALYFYVDDPRGQVLCNDVFEFGGTWYAVDAKGNPPA
jgi:predicted lipoprotein with Yx(FWY)xxD motif